MGDTEQEYVLLLDLNKWKDDTQTIGGKGTTRPVLETGLTHENGHKALGEYAENDALHPSNYRLVKRGEVDELPFNVRWGDCNDRSIETGMDHGVGR